MTKTEQRRMAKIRRKLAETALELIDGLDAEAIANAPLNQRAQALGTVIDRLLKFEDELAALEPSEKVIRVEYQYPDGTLHDSPPWARGDSERSRPLSGGGMRSSLWQDRGREDLVD